MSTQRKMTWDELAEENERLREAVRNALREVLEATEALKGIGIGPLNRAMSAAAEMFEDPEQVERLRADVTELINETRQLRQRLTDMRVERNEALEENERLRQEIADLLGDGFPALANPPTEEEA